MNQEVTTFIQNLSQPWQVEICNRLREMVHETIPAVEERIQYKKPHFLKNGHYAAVISPSKAAIAFMIMNTAELDVPKGFEGPPERKWLKIREGDTPDFGLLSDLLEKASKTRSNERFWRILGRKKLHHNLLSIIIIVVIMKKQWNSFSIAFFVNFRH